MLRLACSRIVTKKSTPENLVRSFRRQRRADNDDDAGKAIPMSRFFRAGHKKNTIYDENHLS